MKTRTTCTILAVATLGVLQASPDARAWKPHTHIVATNTALLDAGPDGAICLPGLSDEQIPIGQTPLVRWELHEGAIHYHNLLLMLAPYIRAGAIGPDGVPDPFTGQLVAHVDHRLDGGQGMDADLGECAAEASCDGICGAWAPVGCSCSEFCDGDQCCGDRDLVCGAAHDSCADRCGEAGDQLSCGCTPACAVAGSCCADYQAECGAPW